MRAILIAVTLLAGSMAVHAPAMEIRVQTRVYHTHALRYCMHGFPCAASAEGGT